MIRAEVVNLVALGRMPDEDADEADIDRWADGLKLVIPPVTDDEAGLLAKCFPPDMGYGVGYSLLHVVATAPNWDDIANTINDDEWRERALTHIANTKRRDATK